MQRMAGLWLLAISLTSCASAQSRIPVYGYQVVHVYPHDRGAFTEGLLYLDGVLYESTGLKGQSYIRKVELETGRVLQEKSIDSQFFGEGITDWGKELIELTWQSKTGFVWDRETFTLLKTFGYQGEGWALTHDSKRIIMSDGTSFLRFLDPSTLKEIGRLQVKDGTRPLERINELEYYKGDLLSNVWQEERLARISLTTGQVLAWIDLTGILPPQDRAGIDVLNGIAYDAKHDRLFVTGKNWPKLFEIKLIPKPR